MKRVLMFHGTSDVFAPSIMDRGFIPEPETKLSSLMSSADSHTVSFPGTYFTADPSSAGSYAREAAKRFGGSPLIVSVAVAIAALVPDEDEVNFALGWPLSFALGYSQDDDTQLLAPWTLQAARMAVEDFLGCDPALAASADQSALAGCLHDLLLPVLGETWDRSPRLICPDYNSDGWSSPEWARRLCSTPEGLTGYRRGMDRFCRLLSGLDPDSYPCGMESCKGRVLDPISPLAETGPCVLVAIGTPQNRLELFDRMDRAGDDVDAYADARDQVFSLPAAIKAR